MNLRATIRRATERDQFRARVLALCGNAEGAAIVVQAIHGAPEWGPSVAIELLKAGVAPSDMDDAVRSVHRCLRVGADPLGAAWFVATVHAVTGARGTSLLLASSLLVAADSARSGQ